MNGKSEVVKVPIQCHTGQSCAKLSPHLAAEEEEGPGVLRGWAVRGALEPRPWGPLGPPTWEPQAWAAWEPQLWGPLPWAALV